MAGSLVEDIFAGLQIRSDKYSPVVKQQSNVCVPNDCSLRPAETGASLPAAAALSPAVVNTAVSVDRNQLKSSAKACELAGSIFVVGVNGKAQTACYRCPSPSERVIGMPGSAVPVCAPACAPTVEPDYRRIEGISYITCLEGGCHDTRCPAEKCPAPPSGTAASPVHDQEKWLPVPDNRCACAARREWCVWPARMRGRPSAAVGTPARPAWGG